MSGHVLHDCAVGRSGCAGYYAFSEMCSRTGGTATDGRGFIGRGLLFLAFFFARFEHGEEGLLRDVDLADRLHALLAFLLLFPELSLAGDVAAVTFGRDVLPHGADCFASNDFSADGCL